MEHGQHCDNTDCEAGNYGGNCEIYSNTGDDVCPDWSGPESSSDNSSSDGDDK